MGYDFMLEKAAFSDDLAFPCNYEDIEIVEGSFPWSKLKTHLIERGAKEQDFSHLGVDVVNYDWDIPGKGTIHIRGSSSYASLDMHAEWSVVLELLIWLRKHDPGVLLADTNTGKYHDVESFTQFITDQSDG